MNTEAVGIDIGTAVGLRTSTTAAAAITTPAAPPAADNDADSTRN